MHIVTQRRFETKKGKTKRDWDWDFCFMLKLVQTSSNHFQCQKIVVVRYRRELLSVLVNLTQPIALQELSVSEEVRFFFFLKIAR